MPTTTSVEATEVGRNGEKNYQLKLVIVPIPHATPLHCERHAHLIHFMSDGDISGDYAGTPLLSTQA